MSTDHVEKGACKKEMVVVVDMYSIKCKQVKPGIKGVVKAVLCCSHRIKIEV